MKFKNIAAAVILTAVSFSASAQTISPPQKISTLPNDKARIHQGVKSGELTKAEAARLKEKEERLRMEKKDYRQDGVISPAERKDFRKDKKRLSKDIYRQKHDRQDRH